MKKKHLIMALAIIGIGTFLSVFAQNIVTLPNFHLFGESVQTANAKLAVVSPAVKTASPDSPATTYNVSLKLAQVSKLNDSKAVVTMVAAGDLRGVLSLHLDTNPANGNISNGEWNLLVAYSEDVDTGQSAGHENELGVSPDHDEPHSEGERFIDRGVIRGTISAGNLQVDQNGVVTGLGSVQLLFVSGSMEFSALQQGAGTMSATNVDRENLSSGSLTLNFQTPNP